MKWQLALLIMLTGCAGHKIAAPATTGAKEVPELPQRLKWCAHTDSTPKPLGNVRTPRQLTEYANKLELSRESLILQRDICNQKRAAIVRLYEEMEIQNEADTP